MLLLLLLLLADDVSCLLLLLAAAAVFFPAVYVDMFWYFLTGNSFNFCDIFIVDWFGNCDKVRTLAHSACNSDPDFDARVGNGTLAQVPRRSHSLSA